MKNEAELVPISDPTLIEEQAPIRVKERRAGVVEKNSGELTTSGEMESIVSIHRLILKVGNDDPRRAIHTVPEFTAGATLCKGLNRGLGTVFRAIFIGSAVFTIGFATSIEACVNEYFREDGGQEEDNKGVMT